jgi:hypothetical protein
MPAAPANPVKDLRKFFDDIDSHQQISRGGDR